jgi:hypothetical protein
MPPCGKGVQGQLQGRRVVRHAVADRAELFGGDDCLAVGNYGGNGGYIGTAQKRRAGQYAQNGSTRGGMQICNIGNSCQPSRIMSVNRAEFQSRPSPSIGLAAKCDYARAYRRSVLPAVLLLSDHAREPF